jgi:hypothetical protein
MSSMAHNEISFGDQNYGFQVGIQNGPVYLPPGKLEQAQARLS